MAKHITLLEDYLNDKVQAFSDLQSLDSISDSLKGKEKTLRAQHLDVQKTMQVTTKLENHKHKEVIHKADYLAELKGSVGALTVNLADDGVNTRSETFLQHQLEHREQLDTAVGYLSMLTDIEQRRSSSVSAMPDRIKDTNDLKVCVKKLSSMRSMVDGAGPHLLDHLHLATNGLRNGLKNDLAQELEKTLSKVLWPRPGVPMPESVRNDFSRIFLNLLTLQRLELDTNAKARLQAVEAPLLLWPFEIMLQPIISRFRYHFSGDRPTNKSDKPEYFLSHFLETLSQYADSMSEYAQEPLIRYFGNSNLATCPSFMDPVTAMIDTLLPVVIDKSCELAREALRSGRRLGHLVTEVMNFDKALQADWNYSPITAADTNGEARQGVTFRVLSDPNVFKAWLEHERDFIFSRFDHIIADPVSDHVSATFDPTWVCRPTEGAVRVHDLMSTAIEQARGLPSFPMRLQFARDVHIALLDRFHNHLATVILPTSLKVPGSSPTSMVTADASANLDLQRACLIMGAAGYYERALKSWSDDIFFLQLSQDMHTQAGKGDMPFLPTSNDFLATSEKLTDTNGSFEYKFEGKSILDEATTAYHQLAIKCQVLLQDALRLEVRDRLKTYSRALPTWSSSTRFDEADHTVSSSLIPALVFVESSLNFLEKNASKIQMKRTKAHLADVVANHFYDRHLTNSKFSLDGARQFSFDVRATFSSLGIQRPPRSLTSSCQKVEDCLRLITLDATESDAKASVFDAIFADNMNARKALKNINVYYLTEVEARKLLQIRSDLE